MRESNTYRSNRRNAWRDKCPPGVAWRMWNVNRSGNAGYSIPERIYPPTMARS